MTKSFWPIVELCGLPLAQLDREQVIDAVFAALARGEGGWLLTANVDHLRNYALNQDIRDLYAGADMIVADGMPLLWAARLQGRSLPERVAGSDLVWSLAERSAKEGRSIYLLHVSSHPSPEDLAGIRRDIEAASPDIVYVALGAPKQERVINLLRGVLPTVWMIGVGISLSFISGEVRRAPVWLQRLGLEWCHRMAQEPGRLAARYLVKDLPFGVWLLAHAWTRRQR
jgi:N-acetylglucosaminyldiphosphoundecaprenol N-acetyl-beta-D-mannosaminyltransferase